MSEILLQIDGKEVKAKAGMTVLEAARSAGIMIPTLCHHEKLEPFGGAGFASWKWRSAVGQSWWYLAFFRWGKI